MGWAGLASAGWFRLPGLATLPGWASAPLATGHHMAGLGCILRLGYKAQLPCHSHHMLLLLRLPRLGWLGHTRPSHNRGHAPAILAMLHIKHTYMLRLPSMATCLLGLGWVKVAHPCLLPYTRLLIHTFTCYMAATRLQCHTRSGRHNTHKAHTHNGPHTEGQGLASPGAEAKVSHTQAGLGHTRDHTQWAVCLPIHTYAHTYILHTCCLQAYIHILQLCLFHVIPAYSSPRSLYLQGTRLPTKATQSHATYTPGLGYSPQPREQSFIHKAGLGWVWAAMLPTTTCLLPHATYSYHKATLHALLSTCHACYSTLPHVNKVGAGLQSMSGTGWAACHRLHTLGWAGLGCHQPHHRLGYWLHTHATWLLKSTHTMGWVWVWAWATTAGWAGSRLTMATQGQAGLGWGQQLGLGQATQGQQGHTCRAHKLGC
jgi:hypothetical protein